MHLVVLGYAIRRLPGIQPVPNRTHILKRKFPIRLLTAVGVCGVEILRARTILKILSPIISTNSVLVHHVVTLRSIPEESPGHKIVNRSVYPLSIRAYVHLKIPVLKALRFQLLTRVVLDPSVLTKDITV